MVQIKKIMRKNVINAPPDTKISLIAKVMHSNNIGSVVILDKGKPVGIVTDTDIVALVAEDKKLDKVGAKDLPKKRLVTAKPQDKMIDVVRKMVKTGMKRIPVVEKGKLVGLVTDKDILVTAPELIEVMSERLKSRVEVLGESDHAISGLCERCGNYSDDLRHVAGKWYCEDCRTSEGFEENPHEEY